MPSLHSKLIAAAAAVLFAAPLFALPTGHDPVIPTFSGLDLFGKSSHCKPELDLPTVDGPTQLSGPGSMKLKVIVIGSGTQNYTCADSTSYSKPVGNGAVADLYDVSCIASSDGESSILGQLPQSILHNPSVIHKKKLQQIGSHYFYPDSTTPVFKVYGGKKKGLFVGQKVEGVPAPTYADTGLPPNAFGAVDWLKLGTKEGVKTPKGKPFKSKGYQVVYRVETAGGKAPTTCEGKPAQFTIPYAALYVFYN